MDSAPITNWIMAVLTFIYAISTIIITVINSKQVKAQQSQLELFYKEKYEKRLKHKIEIAVIYLSHVRQPKPDGTRDLHSTVPEIRDFLIQKKEIAEQDYSLDEIFYLCLELHTDEVFYLSPEGVDDPITTWRFSKRAHKNKDIEKQAKH